MSAARYTVRSTSVVRPLDPDGDTVTSVAVYGVVPVAAYSAGIVGIVGHCWPPPITPATL